MLRLTAPQFLGSLRVRTFSLIQSRLNIDDSQHFQTHLPKSSKPGNQPQPPTLPSCFKPLGSNKGRHVVPWPGSPGKGRALGGAAAEVGGFGAQLEGAE
jgi:hypothetical protein